MSKIILAVCVGLALLIVSDGVWNYLSQPSDTHSDGYVVGTVTAPQSTLVDFYDRVWHFTSDVSGETLATISGCETEDSCEAIFHPAGQFWTVERTAS